MKSISESGQNGSTASGPTDQARHELEHKLGQCMLHLQRYEAILKKFVAANMVEGTMAALPTKLAKQTADARVMTLGTLVRHFTEDYLVDSEQQVRTTKDAAEMIEGAEVPYMKMRFEMAMSSENYRKTAASLTELKEMRNALVHHFFERFDIEDAAQCAAATSYLQACYLTIEIQLRQLKNWSDGADKTRLLAAAFIGSGAFGNAFLDGIEADSTDG
ncbi:MAG: hypothetical protein ACJ8HI_01430 [Massilia sp.]